VKDHLHGVAGGEVRGRLQLLRYKKEESSPAGDDDALEREAIQTTLNRVTMAPRAKPGSRNGPTGSGVERDLDRRIFIALEQDGLEAFGFHERVSWKSHRCPNRG
jgi:hypothetical protein